MNDQNQYAPLSNRDLIIWFIVICAWLFLFTLVGCKEPCQECRVTTYSNQAAIKESIVRRGNTLFVNPIAEPYEYEEDVYMSECNPAITKYLEAELDGLTEIDTYYDEDWDRQIQYRVRWEVKCGL